MAGRNFISEDLRNLKCRFPKTRLDFEDYLKFKDKQKANALKLQRYAQDAIETEEEDNDGSERSEQEA